MTKDQLVNAMRADMPHLPKHIIKKELENFFDIIASELAEGSTVNLGKLGALSPKILQARTVTDINSREKISVPKRPGVGFKPYSSIKKSLNQDTGNANL